MAVTCKETIADRSGSTAPAEVVEISLLLPSNRVEALMNLAHARQQSVGQLLRLLIDRELSNASHESPCRRERGF